MTSCRIGWHSPDAANGVILDGFPRNPVQADWLAEHLASKGERVNAVLLLNLDLYTAFKRAFGRITSETGNLYNLFFDDAEIEWQFEDHPEKSYPPRVVGTEKESGAALVRRPDDANAGAVIKRIDTYLETTMPLVKYYRDKGLVTEIDAEQSIADVSQAIKTVLDRAKA